MVSGAVGDVMGAASSVASKVSSAVDDVTSAAHVPAVSSILSAKIVMRADPLFLN